MSARNAKLHDNASAGKDHAQMTGDELGKILRAIGWTSAELARSLSIRPDTVNSWLIGRRPVPGNLERWLHQVRASIATAPPLPEVWRSGG